MRLSLALCFSALLLGCNADCPSGYTATCPGSFSVSGTPETISATNLEGCIWFCKCSTCFGCTTTDATTNEVSTGVDVVTRVDVGNSAGAASNLQTFVAGFISDRYTQAKAASCATSEEKLAETSYASRLMSRLGESYDPAMPTDGVLLRYKSEAEFVSDMNALTAADEAKVEEWGEYAYNTLNHKNPLGAWRLNSLESSIQTALGSNYVVLVTAKTTAGGISYAEVAVCAGDAGGSLYKYNIVLTKYTSATTSTQPLLFSRVAAQLDGGDRKRWAKHQHGQANHQCITGAYTDRPCTADVMCGTTSFQAFSNEVIDAEWNSDLADIEPHVRGAINTMRFTIARL